MPEQILSQEEIDALLKSMDNGEISIEQGKAEGVVPYDFTSQNRVVHDEFDALRAVYDTFVTLLCKSFSSSFRSPLEVNLASTDIIKFREVLTLFPNGTSFNIVSLDPLQGSFLVVVNTDLAFSIIDLMLGGTGKQINQQREFTLIEQRVLKKFLNETLKHLEKAWALIIPVKFSLKKVETRPQFVRLVSPDDLTVTSIFSIKGTEFSGNLYLCLPYLTLEPIKDKLSTKNLVELHSNERLNSNVQVLLRQTYVNMAAELGKASCTVFELLNLREGDIIKLDTNPQDPITITVENIPKYKGVPGVFKGNRAVQIQAELKAKGGSNGHGYKQ